MGPRPHLWFFAFKTAPFGSELLVSMGPIPHLLFCSCETAWLASELLVSIGPSPHRWFLHAKSDFWIRITSLYGSQTSPVDLRMQNNVLRSRIMLVYWSQPSSGVFASKTVTLGPELQVSMGPRLHLWFFTFKTAYLHKNCKFLWGPDLTCRFVHAKQRD